MSCPVIIYLLSNFIFFGFLGCFLFGFAHRHSLPTEWQHQSVFRWSELPKHICVTLLPSGLAWYITAETYSMEIGSGVMAIVWFIRIVVMSFWIFGYFVWVNDTIKSLEQR